MPKVLITGASGFLGRPACFAFRARGFSVHAFSRSSFYSEPEIQYFTASELSELKSTSPIFEGVGCVLHLAGRAHVMQESLHDPLAAFRNVNYLETIKFAREAAFAGVRRFVFVSSIKVNGEAASSLDPFTEKDGVNPVDPYAISKYEAELGLFDIANETGMEVVIVRPPLIYGPGVKGNFRVLMELLSKRIFLPLGLIDDNKRSLIGLDNLLDFLVLCVSHSNAPGHVFLVSDQQDVSTVDLIKLLSKSMGLTPRLFPVPRALLWSAAFLARKRSTYQRLCGSLVVDSSAASRILGWSPPLTLEEGLRRTSGCRPK